MRASQLCGIHIDHSCNSQHSNTKGSFSHNLQLLSPQTPRAEIPALTRCSPHYNNNTKDSLLRRVQLQHQLFPFSPPLPKRHLRSCNRAASCSRNMLCSNEYHQPFRGSECGSARSSAWFRHWPPSSLLPRRGSRDNAAAT